MLERLLKVIGDYEIIEKTVPTASTLTFLDLEIRMKEQRVYLNNKHIPLNQREFMVLCHLKVGRSKCADGVGFFFMEGMICPIRSKISVPAEQVRKR